MNVTILPWTTLVLAAFVSFASPLSADGDAAGKEAFIAQKCHQCHSVTSASIQHTSKVEKLVGPDLDGLADDKDAVWTTRLVKREIEGPNGKKHLKPFKGTDEELAAIVDWLMTLKTDNKP